MIAPVAKGLKRLRNLTRSQSPSTSRRSMMSRFSLSPTKHSSRGAFPLPPRAPVLSLDEDEDDDDEHDDDDSDYEVAS